MHFWPQTEENFENQEKGTNSEQKAYEDTLHQLTFTEAQRICLCMKSKSFMKIPSLNTFCRVQEVCHR